ncbi:MAG: P-loop NTPase, partial [Steroidobacteraceae bacterium]
MSLVEKALRKLQESAPRVAQASAPAQQHAQPAVRDRETGVQHVTPPATPARSVFLNVPALRAAGVLPPEHEERKLAQQYRQIKRPLILNATGRGTTRIANGHLIMVASAMPGEGKTFTAMNLALSMSIEKDVHVLLVDADVAKPHITHLLGLSEAPGLLDVLREPALDVEGLILATDVPNLFVLPAGTPSA